MADSASNEIRLISGGAVTTVAGTVAGNIGHVDGPVASAVFNEPTGIALDGAGNVYVVESPNNDIRKISGGTVSTFAGAATYPPAVGNTDGLGTAASFNGPYGISIDSSGTLYVSDADNNEIRMVSSAGLVATIAGHLSAGSADGTALPRN